MAFEKLMAEYDNRRAKALGMGGPDKVARRKKAGQLNARERVAALVDENSFIESGLFGTSGVYPNEAAETPTDGKIVGFAKIGGRDVAVVVNDFTVKGASTSATNGKKVGHMKRTATERGMPFVIIGESTGARLPDAMGARGMGQLLGNDNTQFRRTRETPMAAAVVGPSFGSSAWFACLSDFTVMHKGATMAVSSPRLIEMALNEKVNLDELGGWRLHAETTGLIDQVVDTEEEMFVALKRFLSYMPSHNNETPPVAPVPADSGAGMKDILSLLPEKRSQVYDVRKIVKCIVDTDSMFELKPRFGKSAVTTLARLNGKSVGIIANNPLHRGGALDADACRKIVDFLVMCDSFNIPIVLLVDTPGFQIGTEAEKAGAPGKIMNFMNAMTLLTVPRLSVIMRKSYGRAYVCMGGGRHTDDISAWPSAEISFMSPEFATTIVHGVKPGEPDFEARLADIEQDSDVWGLASVYAAQAVIKPEETRDYLIRMLEVYQLRITKGIGQHFNAHLADELLMFNKVVVANRGAVAARVLRALYEMGIKSVAVYSEADYGAPYLEMAGETFAIGASPAADSYLNQDTLLDVLKRSGADGVHPGYGFLSENAPFAQRVTDAGVCFIGPSPKWIAAMGHKTRARDIAAEHGMPMTKGSDVLPADPAAILAAARAIGYPVLVKPAGGGGGIGMLPAKDESELLAVVERSQSMASRGFGNAEVYLERLFERPRHIEFQVLGDQYGGAVHLFERDCSVQRRNQKVIEEATAPGIPRGEIDEIATKVTAMVKNMGYDNIGTVEMLRGADGSFNFLEMNTRLQVEHGVTEEITGVDLVKAQIRSSAGEKLADILPAKIEIKGHAIQARVYAEDPKNFYPSPGKLSVFRPPQDASIRVETGYAEGRDVTPFYDPMIAKVIVHGETRQAAIDRLIAALDAFEIKGPKNNIPAVLAILRSEQFRDGAVHTGLIPEVMAKKKTP